MAPNEVIVTSPNALTIDVEDYFQVGVFQDRISPDEWGSFPSRVERNVDLILEILSQNNVKATFFILGWIAERFPALVGKCAEEGHEIGSHGYSHRPIWHLSEEEFDADTRRAQDLLGDIVGEAPVTYRAPCFSVVENTLWSLEVLHKNGIRYDSSIFPVNHPEYGLASARREVHRISLRGGGELWEFPMTTTKMLGRQFAFCGGGWFRLFPYWLTRRALKGSLRTGHPFVFYLHPWELDPGQPRLDDRATRLGRFRHYVHLDRTEERFRRLVGDFEFGPLRDVFSWFEAHGNQVPVVSYSGS